MHDHHLTDRTMRAVLQDRYGTAEVLQLGRVARPVIGDHDVLIEVRAAGLDRGTEHLMTGKPYAMRLATRHPHPKNPVPGRDVAGTVADDRRGGHPVRGRRRGLRRRSGIVRRVRGRPRGPARPQARQPLVRPSRRRPVSAATALRALVDVGRVAAGQSRPGARRLRRRRQLRRPAREGVRSRGHRRLQHREDRPGHLARRRPRHRLHPRRLRRRNADLRPHPRHRRQPLTAPGSAGPRPRGTAVFVGGEERRRVIGGFGRSLRARSLAVPEAAPDLLAAKERASDYERLTDLIEAGQLPEHRPHLPTGSGPHAMRHLETGRSEARSPSRSEPGGERSIRRPSGVTSPRKAGRRTHRRRPAHHDAAREWRHHIRQHHPFQGPSSPHQE